MLTAQPDCQNCGVPQRIAGVFCAACGAFLFKVKAAPELPPLPVSKQNPLVALEGTFIEQRDPRSVPSPESWRQQLFAHRHDLEQMLDEGEVTSVASSEFEREVAPKLLEGSMTPLVHDLWRRHWKSVSDAVIQFRGQLGDASGENWARNDDTSWTNPNPAFAILRKRLRAELNATIARLGATHGDMGPLLLFEFRMQASLAALERLVAQLASLRLATSLRALAWIAELNEVGISNKLGVEDHPTLIVLVERAQVQFQDHLNQLHADKHVSKELARRFDEVEGALLRFVETDPDFYLDAHEWLKQVTRRLVVDTPALLDQVLNLDRAQAVGLAEDLEQKIAGVIKEFGEEVSRCADELAKDEKQRTKRAASRAAAQEAAQRAQALQSEMVEELLTKQQALRQMSEGKYGLAILTETFGSATGALWEGHLK